MIFADNRKSTDICVSNNGTVLDICLSHQRIFFKNQIRGLRICQDEGCKLPMNRDRLGASNIGFNFCRLFRGEAPMRTMTDEERKFHRLQIGRCMACDAE